MQSCTEGFDLGEMGISCFCARTLALMQHSGLGAGSISAFLSLLPPSLHLNLSSMPFPSASFPFSVCHRKFCGGLITGARFPWISCSREREWHWPGHEENYSPLHHTAGQDHYKFSCSLSLTNKTLSVLLLWENNQPLLCGDAELQFASQSWWFSYNSTSRSILFPLYYSHLPTMIKHVIFFVRL